MKQKRNIIAYFNHIVDVDDVIFASVSKNEDDPNNSKAYIYTRYRENVIEINGTFDECFNLVHKIYEAR